MSTCAPATGGAWRALAHVARALAYFGDAEKDPAFPAGLTAERWAAMKAFFAEHAAELLGLER